MGRVAGTPNWYDVFGRRIVAQYVAKHYVEGSQARCLKYCWRKLRANGSSMSFHTFLKYVPHQPDGRVDIVKCRYLSTYSFPTF